MPRLRTILLCLVFLGGLGVAPGLPGQASGVTRDIPYITDGTGSYGADLYQPPTPGLHPGVVLIHGGSWRSGRKTELRRLAKDLAADGYACFSIDYDTHPHSFPTSWQESRAAVAFLRAHAPEYNIDPGRIAVLGTSAGAQLAALVALAPQGPASDASTAQTPAVPRASGPAPATDADRPVPVIPVAAAVLYNGLYDLHPKAYVLRRYLGGACDRIPAGCTDASADNHIHPDAPPIFVGHGTHDRLIPYSQATTLVSLLQSAGDPVMPFAATGAGHSYWRSRRWYQLNLKATESFLAQHMPGS